MFLFFKKIVIVRKEYGHLQFIYFKLLNIASFSQNESFSPQYSPPPHALIREPIFFFLSCLVPLSISY